MAETTLLTKLEKRTAVLLTVVGVLGSLTVIGLMAVPFYAFFVVLFLPDRSNIFGSGLLILQCKLVAMTIGGIIVSFLPRIIYGMRLRRAKKQSGLAHHI